MRLPFYPKDRNTNYWGLISKLVNGKQKGASFERTVCKQLSLWISNGLHEDLLWRSAMSGGRSTVAFAKGKRLAAQAGDISCIHPMGAVFASQFYCECKAYRDLNFAGLLTANGKLVEFWLETCTQAKHYNKMALMIAKQNQRPVITCLPKVGLRRLRLSPYWSVPSIDLHIVLFDHFLENAKVPQ